ncbi:MAG: 2-dehydro-3-deoxyphosphooctonate aldolase [Flavobacterium sp.]|nr:2-dehydro-3-deoxyphosphooctonate aldolase [Flavobacterium sp.]
MKFPKYLLLIVILLNTISCISIKSTLMNVDNNAPTPKLNKENNFVLSEISKDDKYGFDKNYPVNVFFINTSNEEINCNRYLNSISGPNGEKITYKKTGICCPFPSKNINTGGGFLAIYEISYDGLKNSKIIYINIYEKGSILAPVGFGIKK